jgi:hypothetical protein
MTKKIAFTLLFSFLVMACKGSLNSNPPDYLKQLAVYKEGDGIIVYFIVADKDGQMTTCDGNATLTIWSSHHDYGYQLLRYQCTYTIKKENFVKTEIGMGPFRQKAILYPFGRISFQKFQRHQGGDSLYQKDWKGRVELSFSSGGKNFKGEETFFFDLL